MTNRPARPRFPDDAVEEVPLDGYVDGEDLPEDAAEEDDFLAFWDEYTAGRKTETARIFGLEVEIPRSVPMVFDARLRTIDQAHASDEEIEALVAMLFGDEVYAYWQRAGMLAEQFQLIFFWGVANANGKRVTFAQAAELKAKADAEAMPLPPANRAERRDAVHRPGSATGSRSKQISRGSTGSTRRSSRG